MKIVHSLAVLFALGLTLQATAVAPEQEYQKFLKEYPETLASLERKLKRFEGAAIAGRQQKFYIDKARGEIENLKKDNAFFLFVNNAKKLMVPLLFATRSSKAEYIIEWLETNASEIAQKNPEGFKWAIRFIAHDINVLRDTPVYDEEGDEVPFGTQFWNIVTPLIPEAEAKELKTSA